MADNDQPSRLEAATVKAEAGSQIVSDFANLPAGQTVATASGNIPTLAGVIGVIQDEGDQAAADVRAKADAQVQAAIGTLVKKAGDTMTGALTLSGAPTANLHAATKKYADDGDAAALASSKTYTDQKVAANPVAFTKYAESTQLTITAAGSVSFTHGLGIMPKIVQAHYICKTAILNYSVGDRIEAPISSGFLSSNQAAGMSIVSTTTSVTVRFASNTPVVVLDKNTGGAAAGSFADNFNLVLRVSA